ncbi:membrane protein insertion efficiency factor YidD [Sulfurospirillum arcachonense]|uniref:membrane protein insertion efficiency factor YidD n=1 Tax=Sulfurospirillum arcachonense TaxID=57666 RepID=UPI000469D27E|nr:membrane protein insertion efficiency factor YidD [Sulfurospirillum arcachonense]
MRRLALFVLKLYQKFFTLMSYGSCRYYPTCSEYARWQILHNGFLKACFYSLLRILRCNQLFPGGIDYPVITKNFHYSLCATPHPLSVKIKFWFVPRKLKSFYVIKAFNIHSQKGTP